ncbi:MAG: glycosyltransferase family 4 protein [Nitrospiraceae bacterium]
MKILIVSQYFWPESFRINDLALGLKERGHEVTVLTGMPNYPSGRMFSGYTMFSPTNERFEGIPILRFPLIPRGNGRRWRLALNYVSFALSASLLAPLRCKGPFDSIFVFEPSPVTVGIPALVLKKLTRVPIVFWVQDLWPESLSATGAVRSQRVLRWVAKLVRFIYRRCDCVLVQSEGFIPYVTAMGADPQRVMYFPNWAESLYHPVEVGADAPERAEMPDGFRVMFAGNIGAAQSFETILDAAERLKKHYDIHWVILGDGHRKSWVEEQVIARGLKGQVHLLGSRPLESMPRYFALADALLVSLKKDPLFAATIPSKVQSYLACGRPILAVLEGSGAAVVRDAGAGMVCAPDDGRGLAEAVLRLFQLSQQERSLMGQKARYYYDRHFERNMLLDRLESVFRAQCRPVGIVGGRACAS